MPWQFVDVLLVLVGFLFFALLATVVVDATIGLPAGADDERGPPGVRDWTPLLIADGLAKSATIALAIRLGVLRGRATAADFGLMFRNVSSDLKLGGLGFLAALLPVYCIQAVVIQLIPPKKHPVLEMLSDTSGPAALAVAVLFAVVLAPLAEEFLFRAFLQGWLESYWPRQPSSDSPSSNPSPTDVESMPPEATWRENLLDTAENPYAPPTAISTQTPPPIPDATGDSLPGDAIHTPVRPHYIAIGISSLVFALLHASNWPAPVPLFFLALILGYLYSRTHRLLPCIIVHLLFNALSVAAVMSGMATD